MAQLLQPNIIPVSVEHKEASKGESKEKYFTSTKNSLFYFQAYLLECPALIEQFVDQVYQLSRMQYKSVSQQNLPVTIKYPEMVAEIFPYFTHDKLPDHGKESLWFL